MKLLLVAKEHLVKTKINLKDLNIITNDKMILKKNYL